MVFLILNMIWNLLKNDLELLFMKKNITVK